MVMQPELTSDSYRSEGEETKGVADRVMLLETKVLSAAQEGVYSSVPDGGLATQNLCSL
jgi:hypothetical protein